MPRMLRRAAVLGATAHVASNRGQAKAAQQQAAADAAAPPPVQDVSAAAPVPSSTDSYAELMKLKELLDAGVLTQEEFDSEKAKILAT
jgi:membrane protease subunit (stomatin/prohibitin family)